MKTSRIRCSSCLRCTGEVRYEELPYWLHGFDACLLPFRRMPLTMTAFAIGAISMIGLPPAAGFISKWYMLAGAMAQAQWLAVGVIVLSKKFEGLDDIK